MLPEKCHNEIVSRARLLKQKEVPELAKPDLSWVAYLMKHLKNITQTSLISSACFEDDIKRVELH
jgi:hypothetical protein